MEENTARQQENIEPNDTHIDWSTLTLEPEKVQIMLLETRLNLSVCNFYFDRLWMFCTLPEGHSGDHSFH